MISKILSEQRTQSERSLEASKKNSTTLHTGKVNTHILDCIQVDYCGSLTPSNQVTAVLASDVSTISVTPWEKLMLKTIESAIATANIGVDPNNDDESVELFFPPMTKEQREENVKQAKAMSEKAKVSVRNIRKDTNDAVGKLEKDKAISEDEAKKTYNEVQKLTDTYTAKVDESVKSKENELLKV